MYWEGLLALLSSKLLWHNNSQLFPCCLVRLSFTYRTLGSFLFNICRLLQTHFWEGFYSNCRHLHQELFVHFNEFILVYWNWVNQRKAWWLKSWFFMRQILICLNLSWAPKPMSGGQTGNFFKRISGEKIVKILGQIYSCRDLNFGPLK